MFRMNLLYMLLALIAVQSTVAVADSHQSHQTGAEHIEFEHEHNNDNQSTQIKQLSGIDTDTLTNIQFDCHHCCHCHGVAQFEIANSINNIYLNTDNYKVLENFFKYKSLLISPDLRPPIV